MQSMYQITLKLIQTYLLFSFIDIEYIKQNSKWK